MASALDLAWLDPSLGDLTRRDASGLGSGLSRAVAARLGVDPVLVRVAFVLLALSGGLGLGLYACGTALTRGPSGTRPIDSWMPTFATWTTAAQKIAVVGVIVVGMATVGRAMPLPWPTGVVAFLIWVLLRRRRPGRLAPADEYVDDLLSDDLLVEQWRARMAGAARSTGAAAPQLPTVDLYSDPAPAPTPRPRPAWLAGLVIVAAMGVVGALCAWVIGTSPMVTLAVTTATGGALVLGYALFARQRRLPRLILAVVAVPLCLSGWLATQAAASPLPSPDAVTYSVVASGQTIDLTGIDTTKVSAVEIKAVASDVEVIVPGAVREVRTTTRLSDVTIDPTMEDAEPFDITLIIDATISDLDVVVSR
ncbi:MAG: hypothetical protein QM713_04530 [Arachnia sp.]